MKRAYLISVVRRTGDVGLQQLDAVAAELAQAGVVPQRSDSGNRRAHWISVVMDELDAESIRRRYPALLVGLDADLSY